MRPIAPVCRSPSTSFSAARLRITPSRPVSTSLEREFYLTDAQLKKMAAKGITLVGTDFPRSVLSMSWEPRAACCRNLRCWRLSLSTAWRRAHLAGIRLVFGSDDAHRYSRQITRRGDARVPRWMDRGRDLSAGNPARDDLRCRGNFSGWTKSAASSPRSLAADLDRDAQGPDQGHYDLEEGRFRHEGWPWSSATRIAA